MGSSGSGRFSDYPTGNTGSAQTTGQQTDPCDQAFNVDLEDIEQYSYYKTNGAPPPVGTTLHLAHKKRIIAQTGGNDDVGALPTSHNYLAACLAKGYNYNGVIRSINTSGPTISVNVDFAPV